MGLKNLGFRIEELILLTAFILNFLEFFNALTPFWDMIEKIFSVLGIFCLFYVASPTTIFFGVRKRFIDLLYVFAFLGMTFKDIISYAIAAKKEILANITNYVNLIPVKETVAHAVENISQASLNTLSLLGPGALSNIKEIIVKYSSTLTLSNTQTILQFSSETESLYFKMESAGFSGAVLNIYNSLINNAVYIEKMMFIAGVLLLFLLSIYSTYKVRIKKESLLGVFGVCREERKIPKAINVLFIFMVGMAFFIVVVNLFVEWLGVAIDAPLLILGLIVFVWIILNTKADFSSQGFLQTFGDFGSDFYERFLSLFRERRGVLIALSGLLVLHLITDIFIFMLPYLFGLKDIMYAQALGAGHDSLWVLITTSLTTTTAALDKIAIILGYILNFIGMLVLLLIPCYIWYYIFKTYTTPNEEQEILLKPWMLGLAISSIFVWLLGRAFMIKGFSDSSIVGVDILTKPFNFLILDIKILILISLLIFISVFLLSYINTLKKGFSFVVFVSGIVFFAYYTAIYLKSSMIAYFSNALLLVSKSEFLLAFFFFIFLIIVSLFYIVSFVAFIVESIIS